MRALVHSRIAGTIRCFGWSCGLLLALAAALSSGAAPLATGENPPRYQLKVGQKIEYRGQSESDRKEGAKETSGQRLTCWVVGENAVKGWRLLFHFERDYTSGGTGAESTRKIADEYGFFDLRADGRIDTGDEFSRLDPASFFPRLPAEGLTEESAWKSQSADGWTKHVYEADPPVAGSSTWTLKVRKEEPWDAVYLTASESTENFDLERHLVASATTRTEQKWGIDQVSTGQRELVASEQLPEAEARQLADEASIYFQALEEARPLIRAAESDMPRAASFIAQAEEIFARLDGRFESPLFRAVLELRRESLKKGRESKIESAARFAEKLDQPSPDWQTTDLDGTPHALKDYRGKVVLLDFWYRGCGWCIRSMPQLNALANDFKDRPVAILGMNSDQGQSDARLVMQALKLAYPTLKDVADQDHPDAEGIHAKYSVQGFPTLILIDQQGIVRHVHVGYSATLHDDLAAEISKLLGIGDAPATANAAPPDPAAK